MRHNSNARRMRNGRNNHHNNGRRSNPRVQTFDSNGPDVRIRGNATQVTEKYNALARDASAAGDHVLAESYLQHAEHYQRLVNEYMQENNQNNNNQQQHQSNGQANNQSNHQANGQQHNANNGQQPQPKVPDDAMPDLDQGFLVGDRGGRKSKRSANGKASDAKAEKGAEKGAEAGSA